MNNLHLDIRLDFNKSIESLYLSVLKIDYLPLAFAEAVFWEKSELRRMRSIVDLNFDTAVQDYILIHVVVEQF